MVDVRPVSVKELVTVLGVSEGDLRVLTDLLFGFGPLTTESQIPPGETAVILVCDALSRMGYPQDRILAMLQRYKARIIEFMQKKPAGRLGFLSLQEGRYVQWEKEEEILDLTTMDFTPSRPLPAIVVCLSVVGLYLRTFSSSPDQRSAKVAEISDPPADEAARQ